MGFTIFFPKLARNCYAPPLNGMAGITTMPSFWFRWEFSTFELGLALNLVPPIASLQDYRHEP
jgi:hypothetical protein